MVMNNLNRKSILLIVFILIMVVSIGYSYYTSNLDIFSITHIPKNTWNIHFENLEMLTNTTSSELPIVVEDSMEISFNPVLKVPSDEYTFTIDVVNDGTIDAMILDVIKSKLTSEQEKYVNFDIMYSDGSEINANDRLKAGESLKLLITVKYNDDLSGNDLPTNIVDLSLSISIVYVQADNTAKEIVLNTD